MEDQQAIRTLQRIEKLLEAALASSKLDVTSERAEKSHQAVKKRGKKGTGEDDMFEFTRQVVRATSRLSVLDDEANKLSRSTNSARKEMFNLAADVNSTRANIFAFSAATRSITESVSTLKFDEHSKTMAEQDGLMGTLNQSSLLASSSLDTLAGTSKRLDAAFEKMAGTVLRTSIVSAETTRTGTELAGEAADATERGIDVTKKNADTTTRTGGFVSGMLSRFGFNLKEAGDTTEWMKGQLNNLAFQLTDSFINVTKDIFYLQSRGVSAGDSLFELYGNSMKAGMSLQEYTSMLQDNAAAVVRFGSFSEFGDSIDRTTRQLNRLGVFGPAAEQLAASMKTNAVAIGVPMQQQEGMIAGQVNVFEQLRKTTLMTADGFRELVGDISSNQNVQEEMLGMAPRERAARQAQLMQIATIGQRMGATAEASKSLTEALLSQRGATVEDRFKAAGVIRMSAGISGMEASRSEEFARIMMKSAANRSAAENKRFTELAAEFQQRQQAMRDSGSVAIELASNRLAEMAPSVLTEIQTAAGAVKLQAESGPAINSEVGQTTSGVQQDIGGALTALSGFMKNPLADAMVTFGAILSATLIQTPFLVAIARNTGGFGKGLMHRLFGEKGAGAKEGALRGTPSKGGGGGGGGGVISRMLGSAIGSVLGINSIAVDISEQDVMGGLSKGGADAKVSLKSKLLKSFGKLLGGTGVGAILFSSIEELFTGEMTSALDLGEGLGGRLLGAITAGFNGLFTGFTRLLDGGLNWVFDGLGLDLNSNMTRFVDQATLYFTQAFKILGIEISNWGLGLKAGITSVLASMLEALPFVNADAPWVKSLRASSDQATKDIEANEKRKADILEYYHGTSEKLWEGERTTLRTIGADQVKAQKETADRVRGLAKETQDNVVFGAENLMGSVNAKIAMMSAPAQAATPGQPTAPTIATPQPTRQPQVNPPEVNRAQVEQERARDSRRDAGMLTIDGMAELVANAQQQLDVLKQVLAQSALKSAEATMPELPRPAFSDNATMYNTIIAA